MITDNEIKFYKRTIIVRESLENSYAYYRHNLFVATSNVATYNYRKKVKFVELKNKPKELEGVPPDKVVEYRAGRVFYDENSNKAII